MINGERWLDIDGNPIQAHGGGLLRWGGRWWWYGEDKSAPTVPDGGCGHRVPVIGFACYSSEDLRTWRREGLALAAVAGDPAHDLHPSRVAERPKVLWHPRDRRFVMWFHVDDKDYQYARCGVAISQTPQGPFTYLGSQRPCGEESRDMTVFADDDGSAWLLHSAEWNKTLHIARLRDDWLAPEGPFVRRFAGAYREAPAIARIGGRYHLLSSGCTGWDPNAAEHAWSDRIDGEWTVTGNPCQGDGGDITWRCQSTFLLAHGGRAMALFDRWNKDDLGDSRYVWLPMGFDGERAVIRWQDEAAVVPAQDAGAG